VISYSGGAPSDYQTLGSKITERLVQILKSQEGRTAIERINPLVETDGLSAHEISALAFVLQNSIEPQFGGISGAFLSTLMERVGFTEVATAMAVRRLLRRGFIVSARRESEDGPFNVLAITPQGDEWLLANEDQLQLRAQPRRATGSDDIPF
jgi:DNA-binding MarR family transcriptional regulator